MKDFLVHVEAEDYISVEAETEDEAIEKALDIASQNSMDFKADVMHAREID